MNYRRHRIPPETLVALAEGGGGLDAVRRLAAVEYSKHLLLIRSVLDRSQQFQHPQYSLTRRAYDLLATIQAQAPDVVGAILRYPSVGAWAARTLLALQTDQPQQAAEPAGLATLAAAAAVRSHFTCRIDVPAINGILTLPSLGQLVIPSATSRLAWLTFQSDASGSKVITGNKHIPVPADPYMDAPGWRGLHGLTAESCGLQLRLLIDDLDPFRMATPSLGKRLPPAEVQRWQLDLGRAWDVLVRYHRTTADEILGAIQVLTPLEAPANGGASASSRETFGCIGMSTPADPVTLAVTLTHEIQHAKLSALLDATQLMHRDDRRLYYAPWRRDPRPASRLLHGAYAYLGVARFWRRQRHLENGEDAIIAHAEFARWRTAVAETAEILLTCGLLTRSGEAFVSRFARVARSWLDDPVPDNAMDIAHRNAEKHAERWRRDDLR